MGGGNRVDERRQQLGRVAWGALISTALFGSLLEVTVTGLRSGLIVRKDLRFLLSTGFASMLNQRVHGMAGGCRPGTTASTRLVVVGPNIVIVAFATYTRVSRMYR